MCLWLYLITLYRTDLKTYRSSRTEKKILLRDGDGDKCSQRQEQLILSCLFSRFNIFKTQVIGLE